MQSKSVWRGNGVRDQAIRVTMTTAEAIELMCALADVEDLTPIENLQISAELFGDDRSVTSAREALQAVGLGRRVQALPTRVLSQGQKRRVALARLWLSRRLLWILDEPFAALDDVGTALLTEQLSRHLDAGGMAVVATHQAVGVRQESLRSLRLPG